MLLSTTSGAAPLVGLAVMLRLGMRSIDSVVAWSSTPGLFLLSLVSTVITSISYVVSAASPVTFTLVPVSFERNVPFTQISTWSLLQMTT